MSSILISLALICIAAATMRRPLIIREDSAILTSYDYVIGGGGTSGLTVANRLTEDPDGQYPASRTQR